MLERRSAMEVDGKKGETGRKTGASTGWKRWRGQLWGCRVRTSRKHGVRYFLVVGLHSWQFVRTVLRTMPGLPSRMYWNQG